MTKHDRHASKSDNVAFQHLYKTPYQKASFNLFSQGGGFMDMFGMMGEMMENVVRWLSQLLSQKSNF